MFKIALVVFRELIEISMILGIISAATKSIQNSMIYIVAGIMSGTIAASVVAFVVANLHSSLGGFGDELIDVGIIFITVVFVSITAIWVKNYSHKISSKMNDLSEKIEKGLASKIILISVVAFSIFREVTEIVLFISSIAAAHELQPLDYLLGFTLGLSGSVVVILAIYYGMNRIALKYLFKISFVLLTLIAASLASEAAGILTSIGFWDFYNEPLWDSSWLVSDYSILGKILKIMIGYNAQPNLLQVGFYTGTIALIYGSSKIKLGKGEKNA